MTKYCNNCGNKMEDNDKWCNKCGNKFIDVEDKEKKEESPKKANLIPCPYCGEQISKKALKCVHCGKKIETEEERKEKIKQANLSQMVTVRYLGLLTVFIFFFAYKELFDGGSKVVKSLRLIGSRTLDIYMLHMFFVPDLKFLGSYFLHGGNLIIIQLVMVILISMAIIGVCLVISMLLRSSSILSEWLFGVSKTSSPTNNITA